MKVQIENMREKDLDEVMKMGFACEEFQTGTTADTFYSKGTLERWINDPNGVTLVARDEEKLAGYILGSFLTGPKGSYIHTIEVKKQYRRQGIGAGLIRAAVEEFRKKGAVHTFSAVEEENLAALECHRKAGYEVGKRFRYVEMMLD